MMAAIYKYKINAIDRSHQHTFKPLDFAVSLVHNGQTIPSLYHPLRHYDLRGNYQQQKKHRQSNYHSQDDDKIIFALPNIRREH
jgi:hypothetical protein